jgi:hypothetical protein
LQRALKFSKLFQENNFNAIMDALDLPSPKDKNAFDAACTKANLDPRDAGWLWNYLQHANKIDSATKKKFWDAALDAAGTGW